ncbi:hypothetical protein CaCOL14_005049 [Colletotrichum acutatum]
MSSSAVTCTSGDHRLASSIPCSSRGVFLPDRRPWTS